MKKNLKSVLDKFEVDVTGLIYNNLVHHVPKMTTVKQIRNEILWVDKKVGGLGANNMHTLWLAAINSYNSVSKESGVKARLTKFKENYGEDLKLRSELVFEPLNSLLVDDRRLQKAKNLILWYDLADEKRENLRELLDTGVFYLCSWHANCAKDHLEYQGRVYVNADWEDLVPDEASRAKIEAYIRNHHVLTVQDVSYDKPYLCTRPNCRHFFVPVSVEDVLGSSINKLLKKYHAIRREDAAQTVAERTYRAYVERYTLHQKLWKLMPNEKLGKKLKDDRKLIKKWAKLKKAGN